MVATVGGTSIAATFTVTGSTYLSGIDYSAASIHVEPVSAAPGAVVTINGSGFPPFTSIESLTLGTVFVLPYPWPTNAFGDFTIDVLIPLFPNGDHELVATVGVTSTTTTFTVTGSP